jgi:hypothetical protein
MGREADSAGAGVEEMTANVAHLTNDEDLSKMKAIGSPPKTDEPPLDRGSFETRIYGNL